MRNVLIFTLLSTCVSCAAAARAGYEYSEYYADESIEQDASTDVASTDAILPPASDAPLLGDGWGSCCNCDCYDGCDCFNGRRRALGLFLPSDHCFDRFISPLSNPFYFEDPRSLTEVRGLFFDNALSSVAGGGDAQVFAGQIRGRVTDRASIVAQRLGHLQVNIAGDDTPNGFLSAPIGLKYNFLRNVEQQYLASAGITYFINGSANAMSNFGDGAFHFFLTGGAQIFENAHWLSATGFRIPLNNNWGTQMWYWSNQWDYELPNHIYPLAGINWFHFMSSAGIPATPFTSLDIIDLPAFNVAGTNVVTGLVGFKWKPSAHCELGTGFEFPLTERTDVLKNRVYADLILRY
ncbi:MAG: hypothetical protein DWQ37_18600 [Planctomycetota bacterium]|nr:MAG: hypothetical protein DWQ37_18600 [Planctomycetota bacterium]